MAEKTDEKKEDYYEGSRICMCCGHGAWHGGHRWLRAVIAIIVALVIFWIGVKLGEFRAEFRGFGGFRGGYGGYHAMMPGNFGPSPMMKGGGSAAPATTTVQ